MAALPPPDRAPTLASWAAKAGVIVLVALSVAVGAGYWWPRDPALAVLTIGTELIAFAGLAVAFHQFLNGAWRLGVGAVLVTLLAASWCGMTMFQKIDADTRQEQIARAQELPRYVFAKNAAETAQTILRDRLNRPEPRPACNCPATVAAWEASEAAAIERLRAERDAAVREMERAIPPPRTDWIAIARGLGVEVGKLIGLMVFGLVAARPASTIAQPRQPFEVVEGGLSTAPATTPPTTQPLAQPLPQPGWLDMKSLGIGVVGASVAVGAQPPALPPSTTSTTSLNHPGERVVESTAAPIWRDDLPRVAREMSTSMGERRIATRLSERYGELISRHQVRLWLGREGRAA